MPSITIECHRCEGEGTIEGDLECPTCGGSGEIKAEGYHATVRYGVRDILKTVNDIMDKCNDINQKVNETKARCDAIWEVVNAL